MYSSRRREKGREEKRMGIALFSLLQSAHTPFLPSPTISKEGKSHSQRKGEDFTNFFKSCKNTLEFFFFWVSPLLNSLFLCIPPLSLRGKGGLGWGQKGEIFLFLSFCLALSRMRMQRENPCRHIFSTHPIPPSIHGRLDALQMLPDMQQRPSKISQPEFLFLEIRTRTSHIHAI